MEQALVCLTSLVLLPSRDVPLNGFYDYNIIYILYYCHRNGGCDIKKKLQNNN